MLDSLIESHPTMRSRWRPAVFGVAFSLHLLALAAIVVASHHEAPLASKPPLRVTFLNYAPALEATGLAETPGSGTSIVAQASDSEPVIVPAAAPPVAPSDPPQTEAELELPTLTAMVQPQAVPEMMFHTVTHPSGRVPTPRPAA